MFLTTKSRFVLSLLLVVWKFQVIAFSKKPRVPCFFIFGDSVVDNGNNNNIATLAKGNFLPYGIDFPDGPTGRFTNGLIPVDYITQFLGFDKFIPAFTSSRGKVDFLKGVNYGSAGAGVLEETNKFRNIIYFDQQLRNHLITTARITRLLRNVRYTKYYMKQCLYWVQFSSNDYIGNYMFPNSTSNVYTPEEFADRLIRSYNRQFRILYFLGARKVAIAGAGDLGCLLIHRNGTACVDIINKIAQIFDNKLKMLVQQLNSELRDAKFTFINTTSVSSGSRTAAGITVENLACCPVEKTGLSAGLCAPNGVPCTNRDEYLYMDLMHYTQIVNKGIAERSYIAQSPYDVYPVDISHLVDRY